MIPQAFITEWANYAPWQSNEQVEQDLVICRALVEIFSDEFLAGHLAFRGGTALHKLYLLPPLRYSEDIDLVQITAEPFGAIADKLQERLSFLGTPSKRQKANNFTLRYQFESEFPPVQKLRLKIETNCREHFSHLGIQQFPFPINSSWFTGFALLTTYKLEELLGTKIRALYQRKKGRDLFDLFESLSLNPNVNVEEVVRCYYEYMSLSVNPPTKQAFINNIELKMRDSEFLGDTAALIRPGILYNPEEAYGIVKTAIFERL
jgi:predicted nucleotidyltransferase component of viral defense system